MAKKCIYVCELCLDVEFSSGKKFVVFTNCPVLDESGFLDFKAGVHIAIPFLEGICSRVEKSLAASLPPFTKIAVSATQGEWPCKCYCPPTVDAISRDFLLQLIGLLSI